MLNLAVLKQQQRRDTRDAVFLRNTGRVVDVQFADFCIAVFFL